MKKVSLNEVRIGVLNDNGKFVMAPFLRNMKIYFQGEDSESSYQNQVRDYQIIEQRNRLLVYLTDIEGNEYKVNFFTEEYVQFLNKFNCSAVELIVQCKTKSKRNMSPCKISDFKIISKINCQQTLAPPIKELNVRATGNIMGHRYLKNGLGKTSRVYDLNPCARLLTSTRTEYELLSISKEYEDYLMSILSDVETVLEYYSK